MFISSCFFFTPSGNLRNLWFLNGSIGLKWVKFRSSLLFTGILWNSGSQKLSRFQRKHPWSNPFQVKRQLEETARVISLEQKYFWTAPETFVYKHNQVPKNIGILFETWKNFLFCIETRWCWNLFNESEVAAFKIQRCFTRASIICQIYQGKHNIRFTGWRCAIGGYNESCSISKYTWFYFISAKGKY